MIEHLDRPLPELVEQLSPADLKAVQDGLARADAELKRRKEVFAALLERRFGTQARTQYQTEKKDTGTVNLPASNTLNLKVEIDKRVKWDQEKLPAIFEKMKPADARHFAKIDYAVPEDKFKAATPEVKALLKPARTVVAGKMKFTLTNAAEVREAA